ncbi:hypothetical protein BX600DRAFT_461982 [Xylariales sp. PMI_506]|nr:hypothetical protein BX600DRAFT_461982 [Xylariales sp. PMI_506]
MECRDSALTPENYARAIIALSRRHSSTSVFPGNNYAGIAEWMLQDRSLLSSTKLEDGARLSASRSERPHDLVAVYRSGEEGKWNVQSFSQDQHQDFLATTSASAGGTVQLVFIRGSISPAWASVIGSRYSVDPEFFRRHMEFLSTNIEAQLYSTPSLASSSNNIFRLCVSTLIHRDNSVAQDIQSQRLGQSAELATYKKQLRSARVRCGNSLVREYSTVSSSFSVLEQWISLYVNRTTDGGWTVIAWMDQGRPLEESSPGPWTSHIESKAKPLPILQHHPKMAFRTTVNRIGADVNASTAIPQSTTVLPLQYDSLLALVDLSHDAPHDPLSMCLPLFAHAAYSEAQFLNLMESKIQIHISGIAEGIAEDVFGTFQYFSNLLNRHAQLLQDSLCALRRLVERSRSSPRTQAASGNITETEAFGAAGTDWSSADFDGAFTARGIQNDYEQLHIRCVQLSKKCIRGITLAMNKATIEESRKAIEQSERLKKLTVLATLFIPLSFSSSLFGMNIDLLGQSSVRFWWFFAICIPIILVTYIFYSWDFRVLKRRCLKLWKACRGLRHVKIAGRNTKDPGHIV